MAWGEVIGEHVVGVVAKGSVTQGSIRRSFALLLAAATQFFFPDISDASLRQLGLKRFAIEVRQAARHGEGADIYQSSDLVGLEGCNELRQRASGVADGVDSGQGLVI